MEYISVTSFRANMYAFIDQIDMTGKPQILMRKGKLYELREKKVELKKNKIVNDLSKLPQRDNVLTQPLEWYLSPKLDEWDPARDLY